MALESAIGAEPLSEARVPYCVRNARLTSGSALRAGTGPRRWERKTRSGCSREEMSSRPKSGRMNSEVAESG